LELARLLSRGALVELSRSTRLDSVFASERLCEDRERLDPEERPRELPPDRLRDLDEELFEPLERLLLFDRELRWGIRPGSS
jgi:hypothetical protein